LSEIYLMRLALWDRVAGANLHQISFVRCLVTDQRSWIIGDTA